MRDRREFLKCLGGIAGGASLAALDVLPTLEAIRKAETKESLRSGTLHWIPCSVCGLGQAIRKEGRFQPCRPCQEEGWELVKRSRWRWW